MRGKFVVMKEQLTNAKDFFFVLCDFFFYYFFRVCVPVPVLMVLSLWKGLKYLGIQKHALCLIKAVEFFSSHK